MDPNTQTTSTMFGSSPDTSIPTYGANSPDTSIPTYGGSSVNTAATVPAPTVITSTQPREITTSNVNQLSTVTNNTAAVQAAADAKKLADEAAAAKTAQSQSTTSLTSSGPTGMTYDEARAKFGIDFTGVQQNADGTYTADSSALARVSGATNSSTPDENDIQYNQDKAKLDALYAAADTNTRALIQSIQNMTANAVNEQRTANKALEGNTFTQGLVSGRARYAPTVQYGIQQAAVSAGISKVNELEARGQQLIAQAEQARDEQQFKLLSKRMDEYRANKAEQRAALIETQKAARELEQLAINRSKEKREADKFNREEITAQGENLAPHIADYLVENPDTDMEDFILQTAEESGGLVDANTLYTAVRAYQNKQKLDAASILTPNLKELAAARAEGTYKGTTEQWLRAAENRKAIAAGASAALGTTIPANDQIIFAVQGLPEGQQRIAIAAYERMLKSGLKKDADAYVDGLALSKLGATEKKQYNLYRSVEEGIDVILGRAKEFEKANLGPWNSAVQRNITMAGLQKDPLWTELVAKIGLVQAQLRNDIYGATITDNEKGMATEFFATNDFKQGDTLQSTIVKLNELKTFARRNRLNKIQASLGNVGDTGRDTETPEAPKTFTIGGQTVSAGQIITPKSGQYAGKQLVVGPDGKLTLKQ